VTDYQVECPICGNVFYLKDIHKVPLYDFRSLDGMMQAMVGGCLHCDAQFYRYEENLILCTVTRPLKLLNPEEVVCTAKDVKQKNCNKE
jgi:hypothetical protein